jgi:CTP:phosphocholine cytidylyltransferase-like protein
MKAIKLNRESVYTEIIKVRDLGNNTGLYKFGESSVTTLNGDTFFKHYDENNIHTAVVEEYIGEKSRKTFRIISYLTNEQHLSVLRTKQEEDVILSGI